ncbi:MAG: DNRLRE domain-containing protein [Methanobacteriota archaeon]
MRRHRRTMRMQSHGRLAAGLLLLGLVVGTFAPWTAPSRTLDGTLLDGRAAPSVETMAPPMSVTFDVAADAFVDGRNPDRNTGGSDYVVAGGDPANASALRSLFHFNVTGISTTAVILDATLRGYVAQGAAGQTLDAHRVRAPWTEGSGSGFAYRRAITVTETAGVSRLREPVDLVFDLPVPLSTVVAGDFRIFDDQGQEVPSQVYGARYDANGSVTQVHVVFGATVAASQSETFYLYWGDLVPTVPAFRSRTPWTQLWTAPLTPVRYAPLTAADVNDDGILEVIVGTMDRRVVALTWNGTGLPTTLWTYAAADVVDFFSTVVDVDGDGTLEVLFATTGTDNRIYAIDARNGTFEWRSQAPTNEIFRSAAIADTDGNGKMEIYVGSRDGFIHALNETGWPIWSRALGGSYWGYGVAIGDVAEGPEPEIVVTAASASAGRVQVLRTDGSFVWNQTPTVRTATVSPSLGNLDADPHLDIVAGDTAANGDQFALQGVDGVPRWQISTGSDQFGGQILVDFEDDGQLETIFAMTRRWTARAVDSGGNTVWDHVTGDDIWGSFAAADVDLDGVEEVLFGSFDQSFYVVNSTNGLVQTMSVAPDWVSATSVIADLDGDGTMEVVFGSRGAIYAYSTNSLGHDFRTGGYNHRYTGRFLDGNSPDGAPFLQTSWGTVESLSGAGVTWRTRDGVAIWASPGTDYDATIRAPAAVGGPVWLAWNVTPIVQAWTNGSQPIAGIVLRARNEGVAGLTTLLSREGDPLLRATLSIVYFDAVAPEITPRVPNQQAIEDGPLWTLDLLGFATDPDTPIDRLRWDLSGANGSLYDFSGGNITGNHRLQFLPKPNAWGNDAVDLFLFDDDGNYATQSLWVNVTPVNDGPYWNGPPTTLYVQYGTPYTFDFDPYIVDIDTPRTGLQLRADDAVHTSVSGFRVTFSYPSNYPDQWDFIVLTVDDGALSAGESIAVRLTTDTPPQLRTPLPDVTLTEGQPVTTVFDLDDYFFDADNDALFFSRGSAQVAVTIINAGPQPRLHQTDMAAPGEWWGIESVTFRASDPTGAIVEDTILVTVIPENDPPVLEPTPPYVVHYDVPYAFDLTPYVSDPDNNLDEITITTSLPEITVQGHVMTMLFPQVRGALTAPYTLPLTIWANDGIDTTFRVTTVTISDDFPPELRNGTELPDVTFFEDDVLADYIDLDAYFLDTDSATIFYYSGPDNITIDIDSVNHTVDFSAPRDWFGSELVTFRATDDEGAYAEDTIKVTVRPVNDAPYFTGLPVLRSKERTFFFNVRDFVVDVERDPLQVTSSSGYLVVQAFLLVFSYPEGVYEEEINLTVTDGKGGEGYAILRIEIERPNLLLMLLPWVVAAAAGALVFVATRVLRSIVEEVFLIYQGGVPLMHLSRSLTSDKDPDLIASMFTAIQSFMNTSFQSMGVGDVKGIELADHNVAVARGKYVLLVVLYRGHESNRLDRRANEIVVDIEKRYGEVLKAWNGDLDRLSGVKQLLERMWGAKAKGDLEKTLESPPSPPEIPA